MLLRRSLLAGMLAAPIAARSQKMRNEPTLVPGSVAIGRKPGVRADDARIAAVVVKHNATIRLDIPDIAVTDWQVSDGDERAFIADKAKLTVVTKG